MKKLLIAIISIVCFLGISIVICLHVYRCETVDFQTIKDEHQLNSEMIKWISDKNSDKGIYIYSLENANPYEMLFYYNKNLGKNNYVTSTLEAKNVGGVLKIKINEQPATNDNFVNDKIIAYFIIKEKPKNIEIYVNDKKEDYVLEKGINKIFK
ncbi:MAG: hypothetical protein KatS3mg079_509 [Caloramator sp.]|uniref:Uncharacterized protein n=1 Tax=Caloramator proteoclasticus DSM 10124 TaxID=1121262 RepID=A0A1M5AIX7_9CLOT|nr:hypothetical protein [Caloramator proteoclasticus]GIW49033.1 MAG: hypothetical protein KatS3mg079_509 [Caloramator sp.]SHF29862.1 hypothetical protein SAMN02746091_02203 [Caloramator proteoclasticus DSM 10124]